MKSFLAVGCVLLIAGCAQPQKDIFAFNGSRADGMVDVAFQGGGGYFDSSDTTKARAIAAEKCSAWGYQGASELGGRRTICLSTNSFGCASSEMTMKFQCLGNPDAGYQRSVAASSGRQAPATAYTPGSQPSRDEQLDRLTKENISYEEYQVRYKKIMGE